MNEVSVMYVQDDMEVCSQLLIYTTSFKQLAVGRHVHAQATANQVTINQFSCLSSLYYWFFAVIGFFAVFAIHAIFYSSSRHLRGGGGNCLCAS